MQAKILKLASHQYMRQSQTEGGTEISHGAFSNIHDA